MTQPEHRRDRVLDAAQHLFLRSGFRGTSMEAIAAEAGMAKPTLYAEFPDKNAVFTAVVARFFADLQRVFEEALDQEGSLADRIAQALLAKHLYLRQLLDNSPHALELYSEQSRQAAPQLATLEAETVARLTALVAKERTPAEASQLAEMLAGASDGVAKRSRNEAALEANLRLLVEKLLA